LGAAIYNRRQLVRRVEAQVIVLAALIWFVGTLALGAVLWFVLLGIAWALIVAAIL
jgi:NhaP-type Na+/H+ or K+/H+ antiporter